jgi:hypothetical protein
MGGWRSVVLWTDQPHYHHWPVGGYRPLHGTDSKATYTDRGWAYKGERKSNCRAKPLVCQNEILEEDAWKLILWSCIPKTENVTLDDTFKWANKLLPGEDEKNQFHRTNRCTLLWHIGGNTDINSNVHYRRFLMEVNLVTAECKIIVPKVHFYDTNNSVETQDISEDHANRLNYACPERDTDIPF